MYFSAVLVPSAVTQLSFAEASGAQPILPLSSPTLAGAVSPFLVYGLLVALDFAGLGRF